MRRFQLQSLAVLVSFSLAAEVVSAATFHVATTGNDANPGSASQPFRTVARGIAVAVNGDTVQVAAGTYAENLAMDEDLVLQGAGAGQSIIDGSGAGPCLVLQNVPATVRVSGFTFRNGILGVVSSGGSPTIADCAFTGNLSGGQQISGAFQMNGGSPTVLRCTFADNSVSGIGGGSGALTARECSFTNNVGQVFGGGVYLRANSGPVSALLTRCRFFGNRAPFSSSNIYLDGANFTVTDSLIDTTSPSGGSPVVIDASGAQIYVTNCTMAGPNAIVRPRADSYLEMRNSIVWGTGTQAGISVSNSSLTVAYSNVKNFSNPGAGNISTDPLFMNPAAGNYHLQATSPCINTGSASVASLGPTDLDGLPRNLGGTPDMGAYEFWTSASGSWFVDIATGNDGTGTGAPGTPFKTVVKAIAAASSGHRILIRQGNYGTDRPRITKNLRLTNWLNTGRASIGKP